MPSLGGWEFVLLLGYLIPVIVGYWVIRLAVRHAIKDADRRRATESSAVHKDEPL